MKKWIIISMVSVIFIISVIIGYIVNLSTNSLDKKTESPYVLAEENGKDEIVDTSYSDIVVSPNAEVVVTEKFSRCGHVSVTKDMAPREIVNLNKEKVSEYYKDFSIDNFSSDKIEVSRNAAGICNEHYVLRESDGFISINCKNDIGEYIFKGLTDISVQYLPEEDLQKLQNGIEVVGRENLNKFLEDFE